MLAASGPQFFFLIRRGRRPQWATRIGRAEFRAFADLACMVDKIDATVAALACGDGSTAGGFSGGWGAAIVFRALLISLSFPRKKKFSGQVGIEFSVRFVISLVVSRDVRCPSGEMGRFCGTYVGLSENEPEPMEFLLILIRVGLPNRFFVAITGRVRHREPVLSVDHGRLPFSHSGGFVAGEHSLQRRQRHKQPAANSNCREFLGFCRLIGGPS